MNKFASRVLLAAGFALCLNVAPAFAAAAKSGSPAKAPAASKAETPEVLDAKFKDFAKTTIASINRNILPSEGKKEVTKNSDGTFTARYLAIDPATLATSYKKPANASSVTYIGYMSYDEVEYQCIGKTHKEASSGTFTPKRREKMTELVKYVNGKWTY